MFSCNFTLTSYLYLDLSHNIVLYIECPDRQLIINLNEMYHLFTAIPFVYLHQKIKGNPDVIIENIFFIFVFIKYYHSLTDYATDIYN